MKVAICLSGQARLVESSLQDIIRDLIKPLKSDVFCHFWDTTGGILQPEQAIAEIKPLRYTLQKQLRFPDNAHSMFYSISQANNLKSTYEKEQGFVYDCVIRCRTDIRFRNIVTLDEYIDDGKSLWVHLKDRFGQHMACSDNFAFSSSKLMDIYSRCIDHIGKWPNVPPECVLWNYLESKGIEVKLTKNVYDVLLGRHPNIP